MLFYHIHLLWDLYKKYGNRVIYIDELDRYDEVISLLYYQGCSCIQLSDTFRVDPRVVREFSYFIKNGKILHVKNKLDGLPMLDDFPQARFLSGWYSPRANSVFVDVSLQLHKILNKMFKKESFVLYLYMNNMDMLQLDVFSDMDDRYGLVNSFIYGSNARINEQLERLVNRASEYKNIVVGEFYIVLPSNGVSGLASNYMFNRQDYDTGEVTFVLC